MNHNAVNHDESELWDLPDIDDIRTSIARTLWVEAYANAADADAERDDDERERDADGFDRPRFEHARGGEDWFDVAPETPDVGLEFADRLIAKCGGVDAVRRLGAAWIAAVETGSRFSDVDRFGHRLTMQCLGHGVGLCDDVSRNASAARPLFDFLAPMVDTYTTEPDGSDWSFSR